MMTSSSPTPSAALAAVLTTASQADTTALAEQLAHDAAINAIFNQPPLMVEGSSLYQIDESWHLQEALKDPRFVQIASASQLDAFLSQPDTEAAIVTKATEITFAQLEKAVSMAPYSKIVLWDATQ